MEYINNKTLFVIDDYDHCPIYALVFHSSEEAKCAEEYFHNNYEGSNSDGLCYSEKLKLITSKFDAGVIKLPPSDSYDFDFEYCVYF